MPLVDFETLQSPILLEGTDRYGYRDPAAIYHQGVFHLYFSVPSIEADGLVYSRLGWSKSTDLKTWTTPVLFTPLDRNLNFSSPGNVFIDGNDFVLCVQTYPTPLASDKYANDTARIWTMRSNDLEHWGNPVLMRVKGDHVLEKDMGRMIDAYVLQDKDDAGQWWCFYKQNGVSMSTSRDLVHWTFKGSHVAGENACVIVDNHEYVLFSSPENGIHVARSPDLIAWRDSGTLLLGSSHWEWAKGRLTAGFVLDLRNDPAIGKALMFFHGSRYPESDPRGGWANFVNIGIAWSNDLITWNWPGKSEQEPSRSDETTEAPPMDKLHT